MSEGMKAASRTREIQGNGFSSRVSRKNAAQLTPDFNTVRSILDFGPP